MIGDVIRELRRKHNMSQQDLAVALDVTHQAISKWECGITKPEMEKVIMMSELFNISTDELLLSNKKQ